MGDQSLHADDHSVKLSVCDRGRADSAGYDKDIVKSFSDEENPLFCRDLPDPAYMDGAVRFLCGTFCGRRGGMPFMCDIFLYLSEISAGRRTPRRDQTVNISPGQYVAWGYYFIRNSIMKI